MDIKEEMTALRDRMFDERLMERVRHWHWQSPPRSKKHFANCLLRG